MLPAASVAVAVRVAAVCQRAGSKAPYAVGISHGGAHRLTILIDGNGRVGCRGAVQRWRGVVCALSEATGPSTGPALSVAGVKTGASGTDVSTVRLNGGEVTRYCLRHRWR